LVSFCELRRLALCHMIKQHCSLLFW